MAVREGLMALLGDGPLHGYGLKTAFELATGGEWPLNVGQVYTTLERLERDGFVAPFDADEDQRAWCLTEQGRDELGQWWWAAPGDAPPPRDELVLKVLMALTMGPEHALEVIGIQRQALLNLLAQRQRQSRKPRRDGAGDLAGRLMVDVWLFRAEADLRWLDRCEEQVMGQRSNGTNDPAGPSGRQRARRGVQG
jgi:DNA-binding PadR family transcriptional regulator